MPSKSTFPNIKAREIHGERNERNETSLEKNARLAKRLRQLNRKRRRIERRNNVMQWAIQQYAKLLDHMPDDPLPEEILARRNEMTEIIEVGNSLRSLGQSIAARAELEIFQPINLLNTGLNRQESESDGMIFDSIVQLESCIFCPKSFLTKNQKDDHVMTHLHS